MTNEKIIVAGFGGQGVMSLGQLLIYAGMLEGKHVSWLPSYGPEMRGGTANCNVIISDNPVASPIVTDATAVIAMNRPSLDKFEGSLVENGLLLINSSLIDKGAERDDIRAYDIPANGIADELGNSRVANMVMLGAYLEATGALKRESMVNALEEVFGGRKADLIPINKDALNRGAELIK